MKRLQLHRAILVCLLAGTCVSAQEAQPPAAPAKTGAQQPAGNEGQRPRPGEGGGGGMRELFQNAISGNIQAISADGITIKKLDGTMTTVKTTKDTIFFRDRQQSKLAEFKAGDLVIVAGDPAGDNAVTAKFVALRPNGPNAMNPEDLGKKFIVGEVKKIEETKLTILRPDGVEQVIEVDDDTSFKNMRRESVTLADVKLGDRVMGRGELKQGVFVPATLMVGLPQGPGMRMRRGDGGNNDAKAPALPAKETTPEANPK